MLDQRLIRSINSGRCFVLVGAGPSCEVGYPSWAALASQTYQKLMNDSQVKDKKSYEKYLSDKKYPEFFRLAEQEIGSREKLIELLKLLLVRSPSGENVIYKTIAEWPFACYLTTNYDDEIEHHLKKQKGNIYFSVLQNRVKAKAVLFTTSNLLQEAWEHFQWAINFVKNYGIDSAEFLRAALLKGNFSQNLFLDGFIRLAGEGQVSTFSDYLETVFPNGIDRLAFENHIGQQNIHVLSLSEIKGFVQDDWTDIESAKETIKTEREQKGTLSSNSPELQVQSEAEVWVIIKNLRIGKYQLPNGGIVMEKIYFISQSHILDKVFPKNSVITWTPEAVYRYISALPEGSTDPGLLQQCMLHEYFYAGISFIDKERYIRFFGPSIDAAKASYKQEKEKYCALVEQKNISKLDDAFEKTPDLEKPFFVTQMGWRTAESAQKSEKIAKKRAIEAEARVKQLEAEKDKNWKIRERKRQDQEAARERNLRDQKHVQKRNRQSKKRLRKKGK